MNRLRCFADELGLFIITVPAALDNFYICKDGFLWSDRPSTQKVYEEPVVTVGLPKHCIYTGKPTKGMASRANISLSFNEKLVLFEQYEPDPPITIDDDIDVDDRGSLSIEEAGESTVPVNCFLEEKDGLWIWRAACFLPRKSTCADEHFELVSKNKELILEKVREYVTPLYKIAHINLFNTGSNYYWEQKGSEVSE